MLERLDIEPVLKERLLYSLLNARIVLAVLRSATVLTNLDYNSDLEKLTIMDPHEDELSRQTELTFPCTGAQLAAWAVRIEERIFEATDSFESQPTVAFSGHSSLFALGIVRPGMIQYHMKPIARKTLIMLDNAHTLSNEQRRTLLTTLINTKPHSSIWIAERLEALSPTELLVPGATSGREYEVHNLEAYWSSRGRQFEDVVWSIADKRARLAHNSQVTSFAGALDSDLDEDRWQEVFENACTDIIQRIETNYQTDERYSEWIGATAELRGSARDRAINWRTLQIVIERKIRDRQLTLPFAFGTEDLEKSMSSQVKTVAEIDLAREYNIPYYYGFQIVATLASSNIEQFLDFAGDLFEQIISAELLGRPATIDATDQQTILRKVTDRRWKEIPRRVPNGFDAHRLLTAIQELGLWETLRPNAPYGAVTGIGLTNKEQERLINGSSPGSHPRFAYIGTLISDCIANNLLEPRSIVQGQKGESKLVLYLNRWLCLHAGLPLQYGGWKHVSAEQLSIWVEKGFRPTTKDD